MNYKQLFQLIQAKRSFLCVGLDSELAKIPAHLHQYEDPVFEFNKRIIDATLPYTVAYKPNLAFYESNGPKGWNSLKKTMDYLENYRNQVLTIADAKRCDIGNTSRLYSQAFFDKEKSGFDFDAVTVSPYMGSDSVKPFLSYPEKWIIVLALTSNQGSSDFQMQEIREQKLFAHVLQTSKTWGSIENMMYVVGATRAEMLSEIRQIVPDHFLLVPGVGAQGGSLQEVVKYGLNSHCGLLVNASRSIIFASAGDDFDIKASEEAKKMQQEMHSLLKEHGL